MKPIFQINLCWAKIYVVSKNLCYELKLAYFWLNMSNYTVDAYYSPLFYEIYTRTTQIMLFFSTISFTFMTFAIIRYGKSLKHYRWLLLISFILSYVVDLVLVFVHLNTYRVAQKKPYFCHFLGFIKFKIGTVFMRLRKKWSKTKLLLVSWPTTFSLTTFS